MPADIESMAFHGDPAWHGLGVKINHEASTEEMLVASGLNWTVSKRPMFTPLDPNNIEFEKMMPVEEYFALVRDSDNKILGPSGKDYIPVQNKAAFDFFKKFTTAGKMSMETAGSLQGGKQIWVLAKLKVSFELVGGDKVCGYLLLSSPHIWGKSLVIKFVTIRVVCGNTYAMAMNESTYGKGFRMPHIRAFDAEVVKEAEISLGIATELFEGFEATANLLSQTKIEEPVVVRYVADIFQKELITEQFGNGFYRQSEAKQAEMLLSPSAPKIDPSKLKRTGYDVYGSVGRQPGAKLESTNGTLWGCFNAVTYYSDFLAGRDRDNAMVSSWFGPRSAVKTAALKRAVQLAEVSK